MNKRLTIFVLLLICIVTLIAAPLSTIDAVAAANDHINEINIDNADEPNALNYNDYNQDGLYNPDAYRASDHDPVIVGLELEEKHQVFLPVIMTPVAQSTEPYTLIAPADGAQLDTLVPIMNFVPGDLLPEGAGGCFVLEKVPDQTNCTMSFGGPYSRWEFVLWFNLEPNTKYYWRVGAVYDYDYDNIDWGSDQWSFTSGPVGGPIPPAPVLVSPADFATSPAENITLKWEAVNDAIEYKVQLEDEISGSGYYTDDIYSPDTEAGPDKLDWIFSNAPGPHFKWTVAARNYYAWGEYAPEWHFTVEQ